MEMKKCKECGKLFLPKSTRQQYCEEVHYRPCPVCGKPVIAKYLSDPARRCDDCKHARSIKSIPVDAKPKTVSVEDMEYEEIQCPQDGIDETFLNRHLKVKYTGPATCGWLPNHMYIVILEKLSYGYQVTGVEDITDVELVDLHIKLTSLSSVNQFYTVCK